MSIQLGQLCSIILQHHFGEHVQKVGECLFSAVQCRTISMIVKSTELPKHEVNRSLAVLLKYRLAKFQAATNDQFAEYSLIKENVLLILRYPRFVCADFFFNFISIMWIYFIFIYSFRYVHLIQTKINQAAAAIIEELLRAGSQTASKLLARCFDPKIKTSIIEYRDAFLDLCQTNYIFRAPIKESTDSNCAIPKFVIEEHNLFSPTELDLQTIIKLKNDENVVTKDEGI